MPITLRYRARVYKIKFAYVANVLSLLSKGKDTGFKLRRHQLLFLYF